MDSFPISIDLLELSQLSTEAVRFLLFLMGSYSTMPMRSYRIPMDSGGFVRMCRIPVDLLFHQSRRVPAQLPHDIAALPWPRSQLMLYMLRWGKEICEITCVINSVIIIAQKRNGAPTYSQFALTSSSSCDQKYPS